MKHRDKLAQLLHAIAVRHAIKKEWNVYYHGERHTSDEAKQQVAAFVRRLNLEAFCQAREAMRGKRTWL